MAKKEEKKPAISYWSKDELVCPVCKTSFRKEIMLSGNGRMIAGGLNDDLHRTFEPSLKFGIVYPLIYEIGACPKCFSAFLWNDFKELKKKDIIDTLYYKKEERKSKVEVIFPHFNLTRERTLYDGAAMYYLALLTYADVNRELIPTMKSALLALRLAWLCHDLEESCPGYNFEYISQIFYRKAMFFYNQAIVYETDATERSSALNNFGPDMDKNYGWDGVIYIRGLLEYKYGQTENVQQRMKTLTEAKTSIARIFGLGKSSKDKPGPLLEKARDLYEKMTKELNENDIL